MVHSQNLCEAPWMWSGTIHNDPDPSRFRGTIPSLVVSTVRSYIWRPSSASWSARDASCETRLWCSRSIAWRSWNWVDQLVQDRKDSGDGRHHPWIVTWYPWKPLQTPWTNIPLRCWFWKIPSRFRSRRRRRSWWWKLKSVGRGARANGRRYYLAAIRHR